MSSGRVGVTLWEMGFCEVRAMKSWEGGRGGIWSIRWIGGEMRCGVVWCGVVQFCVGVARRRLAWCNIALSGERLRTWTAVMPVLYRTRDLHHVSCSWQQLHFHVSRAATCQR